MKKFKKIFAGFLSLATLLTCVPFATVSAEENPDPYNFSEYKVVEGEIHLAKGERVEISDSLLIEIIKKENDNPDVVGIEPYMLEYAAIGIENGTATVSMYSLYNQTKYVWHVTVSDEYKTPYREKAMVLEIGENSYLTSDDSTFLLDGNYDKLNNYFKIIHTDDESIYNGYAMWTSEDKSVVTVGFGGHFIVRGNGTTTLTANLGNETLKCVVTVTDVKSDIKGDADCNGKVNLYDVIKISKYLLNKTDNSLNEDEFKGADVNGDGKVDLYDVIYICKGLLPGGEFA